MKSFGEHIDDSKFQILRSKYEHYEMDALHSHDMHELYYLEKGSTKYFIGNEIYVLSPGDFIFVPAGEYHQTDYSESSKRERLILAFDNSFVGSRYLKYIQDLVSDKLVHIPADYSEDFKILLRKIEEEGTRKAEDCNEMQKLYLRQLLILISRYRVARRSTGLSENDHLIQHATKYISMHYNADLSLGNLARRYSVSPCHFSKLFKRTTGVCLNEYINIAKVSAAQELLETSDLSVMQIAYQCGFNDSNYFTQVFKKIKGITPKKYSMQFRD